MPNYLSKWLKLKRERDTRQDLRQSFLSWTTEVLSADGQTPATHHRFLIDRLTSITHGELDRLMILMPPGSAKSTYASILFPPWWFTQHASSSIIAVSHTSNLAENFSRRIRRLIVSRSGQLGYSLMRDERASANWRTSTGGEYVATGIHGGITGRRADLILIDDPIKSHAEADSAIHREQIWEWYRSELTTRLKPGGRIVLIMTRWHEQDLGGQLLSSEGSEWHVVRLPALAEDNDPIGRMPGEPLWPEWEDRTALERKRSAVGERVWLSLFQQTPVAASGSLFKVGALSIIDVPPPPQDGTIVRAWDLAATPSTAKSDPDWTVGIKMMRDANRRFIVLDVVRFRGSPLQVESTIQETARVDGPVVSIGLPEDPGQAGKSQISYLAGRLAGYRLVTSRETGSKQTRALPFASQVEAGNVALVRATWNHAFIEEFKEFPVGRKDDQVDATVRAFFTLTKVGDPPRLRPFSLLER